MMTENDTPEKNLRIFTSRYSNPELKNEGYYTVGISLGYPRWKLGYKVDTRVKDFAPPKSMWDGTEEEFEAKYTAMLDGMGKDTVAEIINWLDSSSDKKDIVLLCFEDIRIEDQYCHRTVLGEWLRKNLGIEVEELRDPTKPKGKVKNAEQGTLI